MTAGGIGGLYTPGIALGLYARERHDRNQDGRQRNDPSPGHPAGHSSALSVYAT